MNADRSRDRCALVVMARYPVRGATKTRLAATIGHDAAEKLYTAFVSDLEARLQAVAAAVRWYYTPPDRDFSVILRHPAHCVAQIEGDLGTRMRNAFDREFEAGADRVVMIGSDAPHLESDLITTAFELVRPDKVVFGPALDGGYYLIALGRPLDLFSGIIWSSDSVLRSSQARARALGLEIELLTPTFDIDEIADLTRLRRLLATRGPDFLAATRAVLSTIPAVQPFP